MVPNQENMEGDQPLQSHSHAQLEPLQPHTKSCAQEHCPGDTGLPSSVIPGRVRNNSSPISRDLNCLSSVGLSGRIQCS